MNCTTYETQKSVFSLNSDTFATFRLYFSLNFITSVLYLWCLLFYVMNYKTINTRLSEAPQAFRSSGNASLLPVTRRKKRNK